MNIIRRQGAMPRQAVPHVRRRRPWTAGAAKRVCGFAVMALLAGAVPMHAAVIVTSEMVSISAEQDEGSEGSDSASSTDFVSFSESVAAGAASGSVNCTDLSGPGRIAYSGSAQLASGAPGQRPEAYLAFTLEFTVTDEPAPFSFTLEAGPGFSGEGASSLAYVYLTGGTAETQFAAEADCNAFSGCSALSVTRSDPLPPGSYGLIIGGRTKVLSQGGSAGVSVSWSLSVGSACLLTWNDTEGGSFAEAGNWSPAQAPRDTGDGCSNLVLNTPGVYTIDLGSDAANSLAVLDGEPSLLGGTLDLSGQGVTDALSVQNTARLSLDSGTLTAASAGVGVSADARKGPQQPAFLRVRGGAVFSVGGRFEAGRDPLALGELQLGGEADTAVFSVAGDAVLGGFGEAEAFGNGSLSVDVGGSLTLGLSLASRGRMSLNGFLTDLRTVDLTVADTLTVGHAGTGVLSLSGPVLGQAGTLEVGALTDSDGTLNLAGSGCALGIAGAATIGRDGSGALSITDGAVLVAGAMAVGTGASSRDSTVEVTGTESELKVAGELKIGEAGDAEVAVRDGGRIEAASVTLDNPFLSEQDIAAELAVDGATAPARVDVTGALLVGGSAGGHLRLDGDATVTARDLAVAVLAGSTGAVAMQFGFGTTGVATVLNVADVAQIGLEGNAVFTALTPAIQEFGALWLGVNAGGSGSYANIGPLCFTNVARDLLIGVQGEGDMVISEGGVTAGACTLGDALGGLGTLEISGGGGLLVQPPAPPEGESGGEPVPGAKDVFVPFGYLQVGRLGNGLVQLFDPATRLACAEAIVGGANPGAGGTVNIDTGAQFTAFGSMTLGVHAGPALLRLANGATLDVGILLIVGPKALALVGWGATCNAASVSLEGRLEIRDEVLIERPEKAAGVAPAKSKDAPAVINGGLTMSADSVLSVAAGTGLALRVTGPAALAGTLEIVLPPGGDLADGQLLDVIEFAGGATGQFDRVTFVNAPAGFGADVTITAGLLRLQVSLPTYTVEYRVGPGGRIGGNAVQAVLHGGATAPVSAVPEPTFVFTGWSDGSTANPRTDAGITADRTVTALFAEAGVAIPEGEFVAVTGTPDIDTGRGLFVITGRYDGTINGDGFSLLVTHDAQGKLTGTGTITPARKGPKAAGPVVMPLKGSVKGAAGAVTVKLALKGSSDDRSASAALQGVLALEPTPPSLEGVFTGTTRLDGLSETVQEQVGFDLAPPMDGTWTLTFALSHEGTSVSGGAVLRLSNGQEFRFLAKGKRAGDDVLVSLKADPADPEAKAIKIKALVTPLEGGWARLKSLSLRAYGQPLSW